METIDIYAVWDTEALTYDTPFWSPKEVFAKRRFHSMMNPDNQMHQFINSFELHRLGQLNILTGVITSDISVITTGKKLQKYVFPQIIQDAEGRN